MSHSASMSSRLILRKRSILCRSVSRIICFHPRLIVAWFDEDAVVKYLEIHECFVHTKTIYLPICMIEQVNKLNMLLQVDVSVY